MVLPRTRGRAFTAPSSEPTTQGNTMNTPKDIPVPGNLDYGPGLDRIDPDDMLAQRFPDGFDITREYVNTPGKPEGKEVVASFRPDGTGGLNKQARKLPGNLADLVAEHAHLLKPPDFSGAPEYNGEELAKILASTTTSEIVSRANERFTNNKFLRGVYYREITSIMRDLLNEVENQIAADYMSEYAAEHGLTVEMTPNGPVIPEDGTDDGGFYS